MNKLTWTRIGLAVGTSAVTFGAVTLIGSSLPGPCGTGYWWSSNSVQQPTVVAGQPGQVAGFCDGGAGEAGVPCAVDASAGGGSGTPTGDAGGDLCGSYPNPYVCQASGDGGTNSAGGLGTLPILPHEIWAAYGSEHPAVWDEKRTTVNTSTSYVTVYSYSPDAGAGYEKDDLFLLVNCRAESGLSDGGVNTDASASSNNLPTLSMTKFNLEIHSTPAVNPDGGSYPVFYLQAQGNSPANIPPGSTATLALLAISDQHGCTTTYGTTGCTPSGGSTTDTAQAVFSDGGIQVQVELQEITSYPWVCEVMNTNQRSYYP